MGKAFNILPPFRRFYLYASQAEETKFPCYIFFFFNETKKLNWSWSSLSSSIYLSLLRASKVTINYSACSNKNGWNCYRQRHKQKFSVFTINSLLFAPSSWMEIIPKAMESGSGNLFMFIVYALIVLMTSDNNLFLIDILSKTFSMFRDLFLGSIVKYVMHKS